MIWCYLANKSHLLYKQKIASNSHYENDVGISSAEGAGNTKIVFFESLPTAGFQKNDCYNENCSKIE
jgi:hypothetical protein